MSIPILNAASRTFQGVGYPVGTHGSFDLVIAAGRIERIEHHASRPAKWMLFPPLADLHVHANRAFTIGSVLPTSLEHAIQMAHEVFREFDVADYARHAERLFARALQHGTTRLRTHADISPETVLKAVEGTLAARAQFRDRMEIEVVAFAAATTDPVDEVSRALLRTACSLGAGWLGAVPAYYADPRASIDALLDLAVQLGVRVDVHLDEHMNADKSCSLYLAEETIARGLEGRVTLSHGCAIAALDNVSRRRVAAKLAQARIDVIALPSTNLYLQGRSVESPTLRGVAPVKELLAEGVAVRFASDNVCDSFYPYGAADLLDIAQLGAIATHLDDPRLLLGAICDGVDTIQVGMEASFVLVSGASFTESLASSRCGTRMLMRRGVELNLSLKATG